MSTQFTTGRAKATPTRQPTYRLFLFYLTAVVVLIAAQPVSGQSTGSLRIYLARHGETDWNAQHRVQGQTDTSLNGKGRQQAAKLAELLKGVRLDMVYTSALRRSRDTAEIARGGAQVKTLAGLNERHHGKFEGKLVDDTDPAAQQEFRRRRGVAEDDLDGGETLNQFYDRVRETFNTIRSDHDSGSILIVGHALTNQMILRVLFDLTLQQATSIRQANDELYLIELDPTHPPRLWKLITEANLGDL